MPVNFGSAAAELAVCVRAVGLVDRSALSKIVIEAPPAQLDVLMTRLAGATVAPGGVVSTAAAWWCGEASDAVLVVCDTSTGARLLERCRAHAARRVTATVRDVSAELAAIGLIGRNAGKLLSALGAYGDSGDPRIAKPFARGWVEGIPVSWLLQSDRRALALVSREDAGEAWLAIERAGRPLQISCVGDEAARRYALLERMHPSALAYPL